MEQHTRFYQASTSELFGSAPPPQNEQTPFMPRSPYAAAKLYGYWITVNYRQAYGIHASNGILFNHESAVRGETFVSRKITRAVARIAVGKEESVSLGNLNAHRDWGHARDFVEGMWLMLQQDTPDDYVMATGEARSVREFVIAAFTEIGENIIWQGDGQDEVGIEQNSGKIRVCIASRYFCPTEVDFLQGDATKAKEKLGWQAKIKFPQLVKEMVAADIAVFSKNES